MRSVSIAGLLLGLVGSAGCDDGGGAGAEAPAHVEHPVAEAALTTITLSAAAVERLGIETVRAERRVVELSRSFGGDLLVPPGRRMTVTAPAAGIVRRGPDRERVVVPGTQIESGEIVMELLPLPPDSDLLAVRQQVAVSEADLAVARTRAERAEQLLAGRAGSQQALEEARAGLIRAEAALNVARSRQSLLEGGDAGALTPVTLVAQAGGVLSALYVAAGQVVAAGTPLFDVESQQQLWVKVPIYTGDLASIDSGAAASVAALGEWRGADGSAAEPIIGPPTANSAALSADLYYLLDNADFAFRPGERVRVTVALRASGEHLVVPRSAIFEDIHGGAWVYEQTQPGTYVRRRVGLEQISGDLVLLAEGLSPGTEVVSVGVAELVGTEFGVAH